jgi:hypothetical protein
VRARLPAWAKLIMKCYQARTGIRQGRRQAGEGLCEGTGAALVGVPAISRWSAWNRLEESKKNKTELKMDARWVTWVPLKALGSLNSDPGLA